MGKKDKDSGRSGRRRHPLPLFSADNPFRRKPSTEEPPAPAAATPVRKHPKPDAGAAEPSSKKKRKEEDEGAPRRKRKRDEVASGAVRKPHGAAVEQPPTVGAKRKAPDDAATAAAGAGEEDDDAFDDESKLLRTVFVGNLPLRTKRKALIKEFSAFGQIESVRIRSVPITDITIPRKGAIMKGKLNEALDNVHAYIVFKEEQFARAALSHNMALDEELYQVFCGSSGSEGNVEAIRVIRDPNTSVGKGIAYVLFKTRESANSVARKQDIKVRDRILRLSHAKSVDGTPKKTMDAGKIKRGTKSKEPSTPGSKSHESSDKAKRKASALSYQGLRASKSGVVKKTRVIQRPSSEGKQSKTKETGPSAHKGKRPAVAARKMKQLTKRKLDASTPENTHKSKKPRK
ncbi:hypothetical protein PR202_ga14203 [Eleusine coracana subsp. coracana]|uniref:RRM domain-containing protein n=1 Tax=Eleusine coracana subsp. coracana TaxID=191504 RepID=A0AAV5CG14_ELECO|nr:hypothetical protein PR202_ga14203 [Eleusine coracana subsp. coracana]